MRFSRGSVLALSVLALWASASAPWPSLSTVPPDSLRRLTVWRVSSEVACSDCSVPRVEFSSSGTVTLATPGGACSKERRSSASWR